MSLADRIAGWLRGQAAGAGVPGLVVGLSGGLDSTVVARLCQMAVGEQALGVLLPCHSDPRDEQDARLVAEHFGLATARADLSPPFDAIVDSLRGALPASPFPDAARLAIANIKPRLRMTSLYYVASCTRSLVVGTGNRCEIAIGYSTKHGDAACDLLPLGNLLKSEVRALAEALGVPQSVREKPPSAGLWLGQTDEGEMGFGYADLERYLLQGPQEVAPAIALRIERLMRASEHKRQLPPVYVD